MWSFFSFFLLMNHCEDSRNITAACYLIQFSSNGKDESIFLQKQLTAVQVGTIYIYMALAVRSFEKVRQGLKSHWVLVVNPKLIKEQIFDHTKDKLNLAKLWNGEAFSQWTGFTYIPLIAYHYNLFLDWEILFLLFFEYSFSIFRWSDNFKSRLDQI